MVKFISTILLLSIFIIPSHAEDSGLTKIKRLIAYGSGDIFVSLENNGASCSWGYYTDKDQAGYQPIASWLLAAYQADKSVAIFADTTNKWDESSNPTCLIYAVDYK